LAIDTAPQDSGTSDAVVTLTAKASEKLKEIIAKQGRADLALRVYVTPGGCSGFSSVSYTHLTLPTICSV